MASREFGLRGDEFGRHKNKICSKKCEGRKEFMSKGQYVHLKHKHWASYSRKRFKGHNLFPLLSVKYHVCFYQPKQRQSLNLQDCFFGFPFLVITDCEQTGGSNRRQEHDVKLPVLGEARALLGRKLTSGEAVLVSHIPCRDYLVAELRLELTSLVL